MRASSHVCRIVSPQYEALEQRTRRFRTRALIRECSMLKIIMQLQQLACRVQDNSKSCPEAASGLGVLRCQKTSEGNSLTRRVLDFGNAAKSILLDLRAHNGYFIGSDRKSFLRHQHQFRLATQLTTISHLLFLSCLFIFLLFSLSLFTHSSHGTVTGITSPHLRHQLLKPSSEASASVSPL
jgi:hypothetical protein